MKPFLRLCNVNATIYMCHRLVHVDGKKKNSDTIDSTSPTKKAISKTFNR